MAQCAVEPNLFAARQSNQALRWLSSEKAHEPVPAKSPVLADFHSHQALCFYHIGSKLFYSNNLATAKVELDDLTFVGAAEHPAREEPLHEYSETAEQQPAEQGVENHQPGADEDVGQGAGPI